MDNHLKFRKTWSRCVFRNESSSVLCNVPPTLASGKTEIAVFLRSLMKLFAVVNTSLFLADPIAIRGLICRGCPRV